MIVSKSVYDLLYFNITAIVSKGIEENIIM